MHKSIKRLFIHTAVGFCILLMPIAISAKEPSAKATEISWQWQYDKNGGLDKIIAPGNVITRISHTESGGENDKKLTTIISTGSEQRRFTRDNQGHLLSAAGAGGMIAFTRNSIGLPTEVRSNNAPTLYYKYDMQNRLVEMAIGKSTAIKYRYDFLGRLSAVSTPAGEIAYEYNRAVNTIVRRLPNGLQTFRKYDGEGRLIELIHADANNKAIAAYAYDYRPDGLIAAISESSQRTGTRVCRYAYNLMHRLTNVECGGKGHSFRYNYDSLGNMSEQTSEGRVIHFTSTSAGALATDSRGAAHVDERGHIRKLPHYSGPIGYDFNDFGELTAVSSKSVQYTYNAFGLLTSRAVDGRKTQYLPDPFADAWQPIWRRDAAGAETIIVWDGALPLLELRGKDARYRLEDHLGSVRIEINGKGDVLAWHDYTPYGEPKEANNSNDIVPAFAGLFWDTVAKVYLAKARAYDPATARFLQPDPQLRVPGASKHSHSLYAYAGGDPVNYVDRDGAEAVSLMEKWEAYFDSFKAIVDIGKLRTKEKWEAYSSSAKAVFSTPFDQWWELAHQKEFRDSFTKGMIQDIHRIPAEQVKFAIEFHYGLVNPPLLKGTERPEVLNEIETYVWKGAGSIEEAHKRAKDLRENPTTYQGNSKPQNAEFATIENALYAGVLAEKYGEAKANKMIEQYQRGKFAAIKLGISPTEWSPVIEPHLGGGGGLKDTTWEPDTDIRVKKRYEYTRKYAKKIDAADVNSSPTIWAYSPFMRNDNQKQKLDYYRKRNDAYLFFGGGHGGPGQGPGGGGHWGQGGSGHRGFGGGGSWGSGARGSGRGWWVSTAEASPSPVGGVYLGGGAGLLEDLGQITGIAVDGKTGKLALIGSNNLQIDLPPLRMDDVVTIFRAVYDHGESPSVTIDPDERNPKGPAMNVKHGPGTDGTYVGWVLFECDRIMKTYQLGKDNITKKDVLSMIKGYTDILNAVYFGNESNSSASGASGADSAPKETWERFWIVPASLKRFDAQKDNLSLLEISLKVNTQKMQWKDGKLIDDEKGVSSYGANAFKTWFSDYYDEIADEVYLMPPAESGLKKPVAIFHELRRIALIAAIAEHLRDSGQSMPGWMRDYTVRPFPVSKTTPSLSIRKSRQYGSAAGVSSIYGGVNLAPADKDMHAFKETAKTSAVSAPKEHINFVKLARQEAASLSPKIPELILANESVGKVQAIQTADKKTYNVAILPGANTMALAPNRQAVTDMDIPIGLGRSISLSRYYNSFFNPSGELGAGWTLNLPRLLMTRIPVKRDGMQSQYRVVPHLINPLGTLDIRFNTVKRVEPYAADMFAAEDNLEVAGIVEGHSAIIGAKTHLALFRDGTEWHFDNGGRLALVQSDGAATRYVRDSEGRIMQIVGYIGKNAVADIKLAYDSQGRIIEARAQQADFLKKQAPAEASELEFKYGTDGRLSSVISRGPGQNETPRAAWTYSYESNHLTRITGADGIDVSYGYDERGQLLWEKQGNQKRQFTLKTSPQGTVLASAAADASEQPNKWTYDMRMRPVKAELGGGRTIQWQYGQDNAVSETAYQDGKLILTRTTSQDGKSEKTILASGAKYEVHKDNFGKPTTLLIDGALAAKANWQANGSFAGLRTGNTEIQTLRHKEGWPNGLLISTPMESGKTDQWLEYESDVMGRPVKITDSSGFNYLLYYDEQGRIKTFGQLTKDNKLAGAKIVYNKDGLVTDIESTWEKEKREYASSGILKSITVKREGAQSKSIFDAHGRLANQSAFDKGETIWQYESEQHGAQLKQIKLPNGEQIHYSWNDTDKTHGADISMGHAAVRTRFDAERHITTITWGDRAP